MYKYIKTVSSYIDNQFDENNFSADPIITLQSTLLSPSIKHNSRMLFKFDTTLSNSEIQTLLDDASVKFIYRAVVSNIEVEDTSAFLSDKITILIYPLTKNWKNGIGDYDNKNQSGVSWNNFNTDSPWDISGGDFITTTEYIFDNFNIFEYNESQYFFDLDLTSIIKAQTPQNLKDYGFIIKFSDTMENILSNFITFNLKSPNIKHISKTSKVLPGLFIKYPEINFDTITDEDRLTDENRFDAIINIKNRGLFDKSFNIKFPIKILDSSISSSNKLIPGNLSTYKIIDYYTNITIIDEDSINNLICYKNGKVYYDIDPSLLISGRTYKFIPILKTDGNLSIQTNISVKFEVN